MLTTISVPVEKEAYELSQGLVKFVAAVKQATDDGFQPGQDIPAVIEAAMADLLPQVKNVSALGPDLKENEKAFVAAFANSGVDMVYVFKKQGA